MKLAAERQELILAAVRAQGTVRLTELVDQLGVTPVTVRRDVTALADRGLVMRVHGGIRLPHRGIAEGAPAGARSVFGRVAGGEIGMVVPSVEYYWPPVIRAAQATVTAAGGRLLLRASDYNPAEDRRQVTKLLDRGMQCLLVAPSTEGRAGVDLLRWLGTLNVPVVLVERLPPPELPTLALDATYTAHALGAGIAVRHLGPHAAAAGVHVLIETHDSHPTGADVARLLRAAATPGIGAVWDLMHTWLADEAPTETAEALRPWPAYVQVKDISSATDRTPLALGQGVLPLADCLRQLTPDTWVSWEYGWLWHQHAPALPELLADGRRVITAQRAERHRAE